LKHNNGFGAAFGVSTVITMEQCRIFSGLLSNEMVMGPVPSPRHRARLAGYLLNLKWGHATVREMIVADVRAALDLGALNRAGDLLVVLRLFLSDHPEARKCQDHNVVDWRRARTQEPKCMGAPPPLTRDRADAPEIFSTNRIKTYRDALQQ
jgi:hypothetical protein